MEKLESNWGEGGRIWTRKRVFWFEISVVLVRLGRRVGLGVGVSVDHVRHQAVVHVLRHEAVLVVGAAVGLRGRAVRVVQGRALGVREGVALDAVLGPVGPVRHERLAARV